MASARATLELAWEALDRGSGDPLERAALLRIEVNLLLTLGDGGAAAGLLRPAASIYGLYGDDHQQGRTLQKLALAVGHDDPPQGVEIAERALALVDPGREPRLELAARHLLIWFLKRLRAVVAGARTAGTLSAAVPRVRRERAADADAVGGGADLPAPGRAGRRGAGAGGGLAPLLGRGVPAGADAGEP